MYRKKYLLLFFYNTNLELLRQDRNPFKDMVKALRFQGVVRLATHFELSKWDELWITVGRKYMPDVEFGKTYMVRDIIKEIFLAQRYQKNCHPALQI